MGICIYGVVVFLTRSLPSPYHLSAGAGAFGDVVRGTCFIEEIGADVIVAIKVATPHPPTQNEHSAV